MVSVPEAVTFQPSRRRVFLTVCCLVGGAWLVVQLTVMLLVGGVGLGPTSSDVGWLLTGTVGLAVPVAGAFVALTRGRLPWVRTSAAGLELSVAGRDMVHLPWSRVESVALRRFGPFTELVVTPTGDCAGEPDCPGEPGCPGEPDCPGAADMAPAAYVVDVAMLRPAPAALLAEIRRAATARS